MLSSSEDLSKVSANEIEVGRLAPNETVLNAKIDNQSLDLCDICSDFERKVKPINREKIRLKISDETSIDGKWRGDCRSSGEKTKSPVRSSIIQTNQMNILKQTLKKNHLKNINSKPN